MREAGWDGCVVVSEQGIVLGLLREKELATDPEATAEEVIGTAPPRSGPTSRSSAGRTGAGSRSVCRPGDETRRQAGGAALTEGRGVLVA